MAIPINEREKKVEFYYEILANIFFFSQRIQIFPQFFYLFRCIGCGTLV